ncbi:copper transport protein [Salix suchowensis]|nr:copper transport protein [Salix suchowensis]
MGQTFCKGKESRTVVLKVGMSCGGCVGAVERVLGKIEGAKRVKGNVQPDAVRQTVSKTGKKTTFWEAETPAEPAKPAETLAMHNVAAETSGNADF